MSTVRRAYPGAPPGAELTPCHYVAPQGLIDGDPQEREHLYLTTPDDRYTVGVWEAQPYSERINGYPGNEFCHVIKGQLTLEGEDGVSETFTEGDSFVLEAGWSGVYRVDQPFMKYFALSVPSA